MNKKLFRWIRLLLLAYGLIGIGIYYTQEYILFHPEKIDPRQPYGFTQPHQEINIPYDDSTNISIVRFTAKDTPKGVVLYFHGNKKNISWYAHFAPYFTRNGYEVWMLDYPGYGKSTGPRNEQRLYDFAEQFYKLGRSHFSADSIIIYGKSLGTGIAARVASRHNCRRLILETPYRSLTALAGYYFPLYPVGRMIHYKIPTLQYLQNVSVPVTILQGTSDWIVPYRNAAGLKAALKPGDEFIDIPGGSHNDLFDFELVPHKLDSLLNR